MAASMLKSRGGRRKTHRPVSHRKAPTRCASLKVAHFAHKTGVGTEVSLVLTPPPWGVGIIGVNVDAGFRVSRAKPDEPPQSSLVNESSYRTSHGRCKAAPHRSQCGGTHKLRW